MNHLSPQAQYDRMRCQTDLYYLDKIVLGYKDMVEHVHGEACVFYVHPKYGRFRQITFPRSWFKTVSMTVGGAIWLSLPDEEGTFKDVFPFKGPSIRILIASNIIDNAAKMVHMVKQHWESNSRLRAAFPDLVPEFNKVRWSDSCAELNRDVRGLSAFAGEGTYTSIGVGGGVISQHFDVIIEDDLIYAKKDDFTGQELMPTQEDIENAIGWHKLAFSLLIDPKKSAIYNIGTRWAPHDIIDYIRRNEKHYHCFEVAATVKDEKGVSLWPIVDNTQAVWPERYDIEALEQIRATQGAKIFECFPVEAPILMSDWSLKPISEIRVGNSVIGTMHGFGKYKSSLSKAEVTLVETMQKEVVKVTLDNGMVIRCTADHPWYTGRTDKTHKPYLPAHIGGDLLQVYALNEPSQEDILDYRYLAGLIDGEGACKHGSIAIGQSKWANPEVYARIVNVVERLKIPYKVSTVNPNETHVLRGNVIARGLAQAVVLGGGRQVKGDIIRFGKPAKANQILGTIWKHCAHPIIGRNKVVSIAPDGVETVYAIGTTTGNYVAYGYVTKNTQYLNRPRAGEDVTFDVSYLVKHDTLSDYPQEGQYETYVDLAGWSDKKNQARNVILTGKKDAKNHLWIARYDAGRFTPSEVITKFKEHQRQFKSRVKIEEIQYQRAIRHFAKLDMGLDGQFYNIDPIPYDGRKDAKNLRIQGLEPVVRCGALHILASMDKLVSEMEDYPYGATVDILDCVSFLFRYGRGVGIPKHEDVKLSFTIDAIEEELHEKATHQNTDYPFECQLSKEFNVAID